jgi:hypothetical protein
LIYILFPDVTSFLPWRGLSQIHQGSAPQPAVEYLFNTGPKVFKAHPDGRFPIFFLLQGKVSSHKGIWIRKPLLENKKPVVMID